MSNRRRPICLLALLLILFVPYPARVSAAWYCKGQRCGTTPWSCCCLAPETRRDSRCGIPAGAVPDRSACQAGCRCELQVAPNVAHLATPPVSGPTDTPVNLSRLTVMPVPVKTETRRRRIESRGPPPASFSASPPGLRAPPPA